MELTYASSKLERNLTVEKHLVKRYGELAQRIHQRLEDFRAADNLEILRSLPAHKCHELSGDRKGCLAVRVSANWRIVFAPNHAPVPKHAEGGLDWTLITKITILDIVDYH